MKIRIRSPAVVPHNDSGLPGAPPNFTAFRVEPESSRTPAETLEAFLGRRPDKATSAQIREIIRRLKVRLVEAAEEARSLKLTFDAALVHEVIDHLISETRTPDHSPFNDGSLRAYFIDGLFADLIQCPSNIFEIITAADGTENYLPLTVETWATCLTKLKETLGPPEDKPS